MALNELPIWLQTLWHDWVQWQRQQRLPHALLLSGGPLAYEFAQRFAHKLLCQTQGNQPCGQCQGCRWWLQGHHPDFLALSDGAEKQTITVDLVRSLLSFVSLKPETGLKVILIDADLLNLAASNALLKMLEEPQTDVCFLLVTAHAEKITATIRSRCVSVALPQPTWQQGTAYLQEQLQCTPDKAKTLWLLGQGDPIRALAFDQAQAGTVLDEVVNDLLKLAKNTADPVEIATRWCRDALQDKLYLVYCLLSQLALKSFEPSQEGLKLGEITELRALNPKGIWQLTDHWYALQRSVQQPGIKAEYQLTSFFMDWCKAVKQ